MTYTKNPRPKGGRWVAPQVFNPDAPKVDFPLISAIQRSARQTFPFDAAGRLTRPYTVSFDPSADPSVGEDFNASAEALADSLPSYTPGAHLLREEEWARPLDYDETMENALAYNSGIFTSRYVGVMGHVAGVPVEPLAAGSVNPKAPLRELVAQARVRHSDNKSLAPRFAEGSRHTNIACDSYLTRLPDKVILFDVDAPKLPENPTEADLAHAEDVTQRNMNFLRFVSMRFGMGGSALTITASGGIHAMFTYRGGKHIPSFFVNPTALHSSAAHVELFYTLLVQEYGYASQRIDAFPRPEEFTIDIFTGDSPAYVVGSGSYTEDMRGARRFYHPITQFRAHRGESFDPESSPVGVLPPTGKIDKNPRPHHRHPMSARAGVVKALSDVAAMTNQRRARPGGKKAQPSEEELARQAYLHEMYSDRFVELGLRVKPTPGESSRPISRLTLRGVDFGKRKPKTHHVDEAFAASKHSSPVVAAETARRARKARSARVTPAGPHRLPPLPLINELPPMRFHGRDEYLDTPASVRQYLIDVMSRYDEDGHRHQGRAVGAVLAGDCVPEEVLFSAMRDAGVDVDTASGATLSDKALTDDLARLETKGFMQAHHCSAANPCCRAYREELRAEAKREAEAKRARFDEILKTKEVYQRKGLQRLFYVPDHAVSVIDFDAAYYKMSQHFKTGTRKFNDAMLLLAHINGVLLTGQVCFTFYHQVFVDSVDPEEGMTKGRVRNAREVLRQAGILVLKQRQSRRTKAKFIVNRRFISYKRTAFVKRIRWGYNDESGFSVVPRLARPTLIPTPDGRLEVAFDPSQSINPGESHLPVYKHYTEHMYRTTRRTVLRVARLERALREWEEFQDYYAQTLAEAAATSFRRGRRIRREKEAGMLKPRSCPELYPRGMKHMPQRGVSTAYYPHDGAPRAYVADVPGVHLHDPFKLSPVGEAMLAERDGKPGSDASGASAPLNAHHRKAATL